MIQVTIPNNNIKERIYILDILLEEFLGLDFKLIVDNGELEINNWIIKLENGNKLIIEDHFFNEFPKNLEYLKEENIPKRVKFGENDFIVENDIPIIFGNSQVSIFNSQLICGIDIFASSFFMLTRWEEYVNKTRDEHNRFPAYASLAYKFGFLDRPIVNEYVEMFWNMLNFLGCKQKIKDRIYKQHISCDVDEPFDCTVENIKNLMRACCGDIIKRKNLILFFKRLRKFIFNKLENYKYDENYTFDLYMYVCERAGLKVSFYFIPNNTEKGNGCYNLEDKKIQKLLKDIYSRGHEIGVHSSYQTYKDSDKAYNQKKQFEEILKKLGIEQKIKGNRQHYLRWDSSVTPSVLNYAGFKYDTTGGYADMVGFRYGVCYEFSMFDFLRRKKLLIKQRPLIVMECTLIDSAYMGLGYSKELFDIIDSLKTKCKKFNGNFSLLWHNNYLKNEEDRKNFKKVIL